MRIYEEVLTVTVLSWWENSADSTETSPQFVWNILATLPWLNTILSTEQLNLIHLMTEKVNPTVVISASIPCGTWEVSVSGENSSCGQNGDELQ